MTAESAGARQVLEVTGADRVDFLQGLITNDMARAKDGLIYAALLSPQGKYLADFFVHASDDKVLIDVSEDQARGLAQRLSMYKLRADVTIAASDLHVQRGFGDAPEGAWPDPRHPELGWRRFSDKNGAAPTTDWAALRVRLGVPESGIELISDATYILEVGFEALDGVDFRKGCYVGQEVTARMKHKTELRKGLARVAVDGYAPVGTEIEAGGKPVGTLYTQAGGQGLAYLRFDRATGPMQAGEATVTWQREAS